MMPLHSRVARSELGDTGRFDFLTGVDIKNIVRVDELHSTADHDTEYVFIIWLDETVNMAMVEAQIVANRSKLLGFGWLLEVKAIGEHILAVRCYL